MKHIIIVLMLAVGFVGASDDFGRVGIGRYETDISTCDLCGDTASFTRELGILSLSGDVTFYDTFGFNYKTGYYWIRAGGDKMTMCPDCTEKVVRSMYDFANTKKISVPYSVSLCCETPSIPLRIEEMPSPELINVSELEKKVDWIMDRTLEFVEKVGTTTLKAVPYSLVDFKSLDKNVKEKYFKACLLHSICKRCRKDKVKHIPFLLSLNNKIL